MYTFQSSWPIDDKAWMKARQIRWKSQVLPRLKDMIKFGALGTLFDGTDLRFLKAFYMKGEILPYDEKWLSDVSMGSIWKSDQEKLGKPFDVKFIFKIWFHPEEDVEVFKAIMNEHYKGRSAKLHGDRRRYMSLSSYGLTVGDKRKVYEFLDARNYYIDKIFLPKTWEEYLGPSPDTVDWDDYITLAVWENLQGRTSFFMNRLSQINTTRGIRAGIFAFDLLIDLARQIDINTSVNGTTIEQKFKFVMNRILHLKGKKHEPQIHPELMEVFNKEVCEVFDEGITPEIDALWQQCKKEKFTNI